MTQGQEFRKSETNKGHLLGDGSVALGVFIGLSISIIAYIGKRLWDGVFSTDQLIELGPAIAALAVAFVSLLVSFRALIEQKKMRQAGVDPVLLAHIGQHPQHPLVVTLNISNVGAGAAMNVSARIIGDLGVKHVEDIERLKKSDFFNNRQPIAVILQNQSIPHWMGTGPQLLGEPRIPTFQVELHYQDIEGATYRSIHQLM